MSMTPTGSKNSGRATAYIVLAYVFVVPALFFAYVAFSMIAEYGSDGVGSAWMFGGVSALLLVLATSFVRLWRKTRG